MRIDDGMFMTVQCVDRPNVLFEEKEITPIGYDAGGANDTTTMRRRKMRTKAPKKLLTATDLTLTVSYDPIIGSTDIQFLMGRNAIWVLNYPDRSRVPFWGWLDKFTPGPVKEGEQPTATITIIPSNQDTTGKEVLPGYIAPSGSTTTAPPFVYTNLPPIPS